MIYDLIIIGGGAAGLTCANLALKKGINFVILEAAPRAGKKILATGNGKCNLSNIDIDKSFYNDEFVDNIIKKYPTDKVNGFFHDLGMKTKGVEDRIYPYTESSNTVLNFLLKNISDKIICDYTVKSIEKKDVFTIDNEYKGKNVVFATGSNATLGIDSLKLLTNFGHCYKEFTPSLVPLITDTKYIKGLAGLRVKAKASLYCGKDKLAEERGEILFKDNGVSGIAVFMLSAYIARCRGEYHLVIDFAEDLTENDITAFSLEGVVRDNLARNIRKQAQDKGQNAEFTLKNFGIEIKGLGSIKNAQVCSGGYLTQDFDSKTLESKLVKGLYAVGEVLNIDGQCGGYNLHWAWASGMAAAESVGKKEIKKKK